MIFDYRAETVDILFDALNPATAPRAVDALDNAGLLPYPDTPTILTEDQKATATANNQPAIIDDYARALWVLEQVIHNAIAEIDNTDATEAEVVRNISNRLVDTGMLDSLPPLFFHDLAANYTDMFRAWGWPETTEPHWFRPDKDETP